MAKAPFIGAYEVFKRCMKTDLLQLDSLDYTRCRYPMRLHANVVSCPQISAPDTK